MSDVLLSIRDLHVSYGKVQAVNGVSVEVPRGEIVTVIGANGAGKTTLLNAAMGILPARGSITFEGKDILRRPVEDRVGSGMTLVPERRELFASMPVEDNLMLGGFLVTAAERAEQIEQV